MKETPIERLVRIVFNGDWAAWRRSLPERETVESATGRWRTRKRT